jgi:hypothetical protein
VNRFRIAMTFVEAAKVAITAGMAATMTSPPLFQMPPAAAFAGVVAVAFLGVVSAQMPSWSDSVAAAKE